MAQASSSLRSSNAGGQAVCAGEPTPAIISQLNFLESALQRLDGNIGSLHDKIQPVLNTIPYGDNGKPVPESPMSDLAARISICAKMTEQMADRVYSLVERVEL